MSSIEIQFNGEKRSIVSATVEDLLSEFNLGEKRLAIELNKEIVSRSNFSTTKLSAGDVVEVVHFVGGG